jgi:hypothetical protein
VTLFQKDGTPVTVKYGQEPIDGEDVFLEETGANKSDGYWGNLGNEATGFFKSIFGF